LRFVSDSTLITSDAKSIVSFGGRMDRLAMKDAHGGIAGYARRELVTPARRERS
jgi:hypothetical protein